MMLAAAFLLLAQDPWTELDSASPEKAYRAIERLASGGPELRAALAERAARAEGRLKTHLQAALQGTLSPVRRVTLKPGTRGVIEALQDVARQSGLPLDWESLTDEKLADVTLDLADAHPLDALAAVCRAAELSPSWEPDRIAIYTGGFVDAPASRFGPFQLRLARVCEERIVEFVRAPRESLVLELALTFEHGLPLLGVTGLDILEAHDERGSDLRLPAEAPQGPEPALEQIARPEHLQDADLPARLQALPRGARSLALLRGILRVRLPRVLRAVELAQPVPGASASLGGMKIRVTNVRRDESRLLVDVSFEDRALAGRPLLVSGWRADGGRERIHASVLETPAEGTVHLAVEVQPRPAQLRLDKDAIPALLDRLRVDVVEEAVERSIPFEFRGVPLR